MIIDYREQRENNLASLFEDNFFFGRKLEVLLELVDSFRKNGVKWALLCSSQLFCKGVVDDFNDYDILVSNESVDGMKKSMKELNATSKERGDQTCFDSSMFERYQIKGIDIDVVADYTIVTFGKRYRYSYNENETEILSEQGVKIPLVSMETQFLLYRMMEGWQARRRWKSKMIEAYLMSQGISNESVLKDALKQNIPDFLKANIKRLL